MKEMWDAFCAWPPLVPFLFSIVGICAVILIATLVRQYWDNIRQYWDNIRQYFWRALGALAFLALAAVTIAPLVAIVAVLFIWTPLWLAIFATCAIFLLFLVCLLSGLGRFEVEEGTGTAFKFLSNYCCSVISLKEHCINPGDFIAEGPEPTFAWLHWFIVKIGGWIFYCKWFVEPTPYLDKNNADGFGEKFSVFLNQIQRDLILNKAETKKGEEIPLNLKAAFKLKVVNIYLFLYVAPKDVITKVIEIMEAMVRAWIKGHSYDEIQEVSSNGGGKICNTPGTEIDDSIRKIRDWGVDVLKESIAIMDVGLTDEDQKAFAEKKRQKLRTAAGAQEVLGGMLENVAMSMGFSGDDKKGTTGGDAARGALQASPEGKKILEAMVAKANQVVVQRALGVKPTLFGNADGSPLDGLTASLASLVALAKGALSGSAPSSDPGNPGKGEKKGKRKNMTDTEANKYLDDFLAGKEDDEDEEEDEEKK